MSVHQTRDHFLEKEGRIVDNPNVRGARARAGRGQRCVSHPGPSARPVPAWVVLGLGAAGARRRRHFAPNKPHHRSALTHGPPGPRHAAPREYPAQVGAALTSVYWRPGNSAAFLDLVDRLTGKPLLADAWVARLQVPLADLLTREKAEYEAAVKAGPK